MSDLINDGFESVAGKTPKADATLADEAFGVGDVVMGDSTRVVTARGTEDGLILRIDGRADWNSIISDLEAFLGGRRRFFEGGEVSVEWLERLPTKEQSAELEVLLKQQYGIEIITRRRRVPRLREDDVTKQQSKSAGITIPLFDEGKSDPSSMSITRPEAGSSKDQTISKEHPSSKEFGKEFGRGESLLEQVERLAEGADIDSILSERGFSLSAGSSNTQEFSGAKDEQGSRKYMNRMARLLGEDLFYEEDANAKVFFGTLRSGQRLESPFSLVIIGDVNPGADLVAGGDIIVVGSLRGTAHASAYDDDSFDRVILALHMQPMQLRIGSVISRGSDEAGKVPEIARIENRRIIVEPYNSRSSVLKKGAR